MKREMRMGSDGQLKEVLVKRTLKCPRMGVDCSNHGHVTYTGGVWHGPVEGIPNCTGAQNNTECDFENPSSCDCTDMYTCVNDGCPVLGDDNMTCKFGYEGPLCAVCSEGYFPQLRSCKDCGGSGPGSLSIVFFIVSLLCIVGLVVTVYRHRRFLASTGVFSHVKVRG